MSTSGGAGSVPLSNPVILTGPTASADRPPDESKIREARSYIVDQTQEQMLQDLQNNRTFSVTASLISRLRSQLQAQRTATGERRFTDQEIRLALSQAFNADSNPMEGLRDPRTGLPNPEVMAAIRGEEAPPNPGSNAGQQQQDAGHESGGAAYARMVRGQGNPQPNAPAPRAPVPPQPQPPPPPMVASAPMPPPPGPRAPMPGPDGAPRPPVGPDGLPLPDAPVVAHAGFVSGDAPVVPTRTPEAPRRPEGMRGESRTLLGSTDPRGVGPSTETVDGFLTMAKRGLCMLGGGQPQGAPPPNGAAVPRDTFQAICRDGDTALANSDSSEGSDRPSPLGFGRGSTSAAALLRRGRARDGFGGSGGGFA